MTAIAVAILGAGLMNALARLFCTDLAIRAQRENAAEWRRANTKTWVFKDDTRSTEKPS